LIWGVAGWRIGARLYYATCTGLKKERRNIRIGVELYYNVDYTGILMSKLPEVLPQARVSEGTLSWLKAKAKEQDRSLAYVIREALDQYIERNSTKGDQ
jgi:hypothetical protein